MFRLPETFALSPPSLRDLRPLPPASSYAYPSICALGHALARRACDAGARKAAKRVSNTSPARFARLELIPHSLVSRETREGHPRRPKREREREGSTRARAARSFVAASVLAALVLRRRRSGERNAGCVVPRRRTGFSTHMFHVKHASTNRPSSLAPGPCPCRDHVVSRGCTNTISRLE